LGAKVKCWHEERYRSRMGKPLCGTEKRDRKTLLRIQEGRGVKSNKKTVKKQKIKPLPKNPHIEGEKLPEREALTKETLQIMNRKVNENYEEGETP